MSRLAVLLALGSALVAVPSVEAQGVTTAGIRGAVTSNGAPAANVQIVARNTATGFARGTLTNSAGQYFIANLAPGGPYTVSASSVGLASAEQTGIQLVLSQTTTVDFDLATQAIAIEGLTVTAENNPVLSRSRTGAATVVTEEVLEATPTISRNFTEVARLSPHVTGSSETPSVGGANNRFNNIQIDGATSSDIFGLGSSGTPGGQGTAAKPIPLDAIDQFQVLVAPFDVRQAGFTGGLINAVTKSGTNEFQGSAFINFRNESFVRGGDIEGFGQTLRAPSEFTNRQYGATVGGPILRDRLHFFFSGEVEDRSTPGAFGRLDESSNNIRTATIDEIISIAEGYGIEPGNADRFTEEVSFGNMFGRLDFRLNDSHRLVLRHNYAPKWRDDAGPSRGGSNFDLSSYAYTYKTDVNSTVLQLFSDLGTGLSNELLVNFQRIIDRPSPEARYPRVQVTVNDTVGGVTQRRTVRLGAELSRQYNELDQDMFQVTNNLVWNAGAHRLTFGFNGEYFAFRNAFVQDWIGTYDFGSVEDFRAGRVSRFTRNVPLRGDPAAVFDVFQPGGYVQDEWTVNDNLNVTAGLRVDVPFMLDDPAENATFVQAFGRSNAETPSGKPLISPRVGFNWQSDSELRTQVRGGVGLFAGRPPYVWLSNAFSNTGSDFALLTCTGANVPVYNAQTARQAPTNCGAGQPSAGQASVNLFSPDYRFPQELKASLGLDQELPLGLTGTLEMVYTRGVDRTISSEVNLAGPQSVPASATQGLGPRTFYGTPQNDRDFAFNPVRIDNRFRHVVELDRLSAGDAYTVVAELARSFGESVDLRAAYTWNRSRDPGSFGSSTATSNVGLHPIGEEINDFSLAPSSFERPHKLTLVGAWTLPSRFGGGELSAVYIGQSGRNYYYIYQGDVNGDGYPGIGLTNRYNDLIYVPNDLSELAFASDNDRRLFGELIEMEECLQNSRGKILERYTCRAPWQNRLDARISQPVPLGGTRRVQLEVNVFNLPNLLNSDWGLQQGIAFADAFALNFDNRVDSRDPNSAPRFTYSGRTTRGEDGVQHAEKPYSTFFDSRYQIQLGLRYAF